MVCSTLYARFRLVGLTGSQVFWIFVAVEAGFLSVAIIAAWLISPKKPNQRKKTIYECGQEPFGEARSYRILGITRYFGYAAAFFALDAFAWMVITSAISVNFTLETLSILLTYGIIIALGIAYFLSEKKYLVR
jgi:NADH:ubiquinone oxidoreductase subunit 3 (subunit A)